MTTSEPKVIATISHTFRRRAAFELAFAVGAGLLCGVLSVAGLCTLAHAAIKALFA